MNNTDQASRDIHRSDNADHSHGKRGGLHPVSRVIVTFFYILVVVSFPVYDLMGLVSMVLYPLVYILWHEISVPAMLRRVWPVLLLTAAAGVAGPVMNREVCVTLGGITVTSDCMAKNPLFIGFSGLLKS